jgi:hypothetical protein
MAANILLEVETALTEVVFKDYDIFAPKNPEFGTFKVINVPGQICAIKGVYKLTGTMAAQVGAQAVELEFELSEAAFKATGASLKINGNVSKFTGNFKEKMTGANIGSELGTF